MIMPRSAARGRTLVPLAILITLAACGDGSESVGAAGGATSLSVSFAATGADSTSSGKALLVGTTADTMVITRVQLVLNEVKLRRAGITSCPDSMASSRDGSRSADDRGCSRLDLGPMLVDLPLSGVATSPLAVTVPAGTYHEFEFELDDVSDGRSASVAERAFLAAHPDFRDVSVRVNGTYKGVPFTFLSHAKAEVEFEFEPSLTVQTGVNDNLSIALDMGAWFKDAAGRILAPSVATQTRIDQNILTSFSAFGDRDRDGREDGGRGRGRGRGRGKDD